MIRPDDSTPHLASLDVAKYMLRPDHAEYGGKKKSSIVGAKVRLHLLVSAGIVKPIRSPQVYGGPTAPLYFHPSEAATALIVDELNAMNYPKFFLREVGNACRSWGPINPRPDHFSDEVTPALAALVSARDGISYHMVMRVFTHIASTENRLVATHIADSRLPVPSLPDDANPEQWQPRTAFTIALLPVLLPLAIRIFGTEGMPWSDGRTVSVATATRQ